ncbi:MAG: hypothetical protein ACI8PT_004403, partial [Gammaproteobacteria bacterium]
MDTSMDKAPVSEASSRYRVGVDIGGTFTDV